MLREKTSAAAHVVVGCESTRHTAVFRSITNITASATAKVGQRAEPSMANS